MTERPGKYRCIQSVHGDRFIYEETEEERERREKHGIEQVKKMQLMYERLSNRSHEVEDKEDIEPLENSRLQLLNDDCLCSIFDHLTIVDLSRISQLDVRFQVLIQQRVIGKKLININCLLNLPEWFTKRILKQFGQHFRKVTAQSEVIHEDPFERFLEIVTNNCSLNTLTEVEMKFSYACVESLDIERLSIPYFSKVQKLILRDFKILRNNFQFFEGLANITTDLKVLILDDVHVVSFGSKSRLKFNFDLSAFLKSKPKLRTFSYRGNHDISPMVVDTLKQDCIDLKTYIHIHLKNPYRDLNTISDEMKNRYNYLSEIVSLKNVTMTSYTQCGSDLCYPLQQLAAKNQLESLKVYVNIGNAIELLENERFLHARQTFGHFTSLRNIDIQIEYHRMDRHDLKINYLFYFMSTCPSLNRVRIIGQRIDNVNQILEIAPNIRVLCLGQVTMKYLPVEMKKIVQSAMKIRKRQLELGEHKPLLHLNLNLQQWREVQIYENIDDILTCDIDKTKFLLVRN